MVADGSLYAFDGNTYWIDAGTPSTYLDANLDLLSDRRGVAEAGVHATAQVDGDVECAAIGASATIEEGASVIRSVVLAGATVRRGAVVRDSIVGPRATVGRDAIIQDGSVIGDDVVIEAGEVRDAVAEIHADGLVNFSRAFVALFHQRLHELEFFRERHVLGRVNASGRK